MKLSYFLSFAFGLCFISSSCFSQTEDADFQAPVTRGGSFKSGGTQGPTSPKPGPVTTPAPTPDPVPAPTIEPQPQPVPNPIEPALPSQNQELGYLELQAFFNGENLLKNEEMLSVRTGIKDLVLGSWLMKSFGASSGADPFSQKSKHLLIWKRNMVQFLNWELPEVEFIDRVDDVEMVDDFTVRTILEARRNSDSKILAKNSYQCRLILKLTTRDQNLVCQWHSKTPNGSYRDRGFLLFYKKTTTNNTNLGGQ